VILVLGIEDHSGSNKMWYCVLGAAPQRNFAVLVATNAGGKGVAEACDKTAGELIRIYQNR
jgi:hypothetical protein